MFATAASATAGSVVAMTTMAQSETVQSAQREAAAELRGVVATSGEVATDRAMKHGFCTMSSIVTLHRTLPAEVSVTAAACAAGAAAAMLLPTIHQADGWKNLAIGQAIGNRFAATFSQMTQDPSLMGCEEAVQALEPFASASWSIGRFLGARPPRSLVLQSAGQADALERLLEEAVEEAEADLVGVGPRAALMRNWAGVLLQLTRTPTLTRTLTPTPTLTLTLPLSLTRSSSPQRAARTKSSSEAEAINDTACRWPGRRARARLVSP